MILTDLLPCTRVSPFKSPYLPDGKVWVKREDETGYAITGNKRRKYASLIGWLKNHLYLKAAVIGGARSNNVVGLCQMLIEYDIKPTLYLKVARGEPGPGNPLLVRMLVEEDQINWVNSADWDRVEEIAKEEANGRTYVIPEGANCEGSLPGALTLLDDIRRNEEESNIEFDHIIIDSGTGLSAGALILANAELDKPKQIHVVLLAGDEAYFESQLDLYQKWNRTQHTLRDHTLYYPGTARSFGSVNRMVLDKMVELARGNGILSDPIYSAKLFREAELIVLHEKLEGKVLIIHSGGAQAIPSFSEKLYPIL